MRPSIEAIRSRHEPIVRFDIAERCVRLAVFNDRTLEQVTRESSSRRRSAMIVFSLQENSKCQAQQKRKHHAGGRCETYLELSVIHV